jgi:MFS transporter, ACS family, glucarate transporter
MNRDVSSLSTLQRPTRVRYGVLGFACALSMITYLDRVCFATVAPYIGKEFDLSKQELGWLFTAFALAYAMFEVPSGWMGDVFGPRRTLIRIVLWWSLFTALTGTIFPYPSWPWFAFAAMFLVRFLFGMGEAGAYPNIARSFHNWFPFQERGFAQGTVWMAGRFAGGLSAFAVLALMIHTQTPDGESVVLWRHAFWIFGGLGVIWCAVFWWWFRDRPEEHPSVNTAELAHIRGEEVAERVRADSRIESVALAKKSTDITVGAEPETGLQQRPAFASAVGHAGTITKEPSPPMDMDPFTAEEESLAQEGESHANVPWRRLLGSVNLWTLCLMYFCGSYGWYFNITWLPKYLNSTYNVSQETHGFWTMSLLSGAPLLLGSLACLFGGLLTDAFIRRTGDRKWGRRLFGALGHGVCALCYFLSLTASNPWLFVLAIALAAFWNDLTMGAAWASCIDIGRHYSGIVSGCMNTVGNLGGAAAGITTGWVLDRFAPHGWTVNFLVFGGVYVVAMLLWLRFDATKPVVPTA